MEDEEGIRQPHSVPLVRLAAEDKLYDRELLLGRDARSVFPTETVSSEGGQGSASGAGMFESMGAVKFITESQLQEIKSKRGERVDDGTVSADKSLSEVLAENKAAKEEAFQEIWRSMKVGKNRPLDEDEAGFYDEMAKKRWFEERETKQADEDQLAAFKVARLEQVAAAVELPKLHEFSSPSPASQMAAVTTKRRAPQVCIKPMVKVKVIKKSSPNSGTRTPSSPDLKQHDDIASNRSGGLLGIAAYGSDDESD
mmetsp:Transcript_35339/g.67580  ORF Transcript_35339/g.67580 Transcript_35339/m.67580 type:complete len:255 (+) Transcript_35339:254-1018(+)|eukprot:CAMPEP_0114255140 /NCGR_PEP_ID=MMETSP0058-20121206/17389_1 /TAXON_ID=36894 /ORGANISM="Pyramimonas parkeae, CCMP726" /LENGTH=254 /DNA_ID=CAMNT_0001369477 /DNA_START=250 /DNA_END=1014 /DNA_ORIENTATION=-